MVTVKFVSRQSIVKVAFVEGVCAQQPPAMMELQMVSKWIRIVVQVVHPARTARCVRLATIAKALSVKMGGVRYRVVKTVGRTDWRQPSIAGDHVLAVPMDAPVSSGRIASVQYVVTNNVCPLDVLMASSMGRKRTETVAGIVRPAV